MVEINKFILADSGFWFALLNSRDEYYEQAVQIEQEIENCKLLFPWPVLYEVVNSKFVKSQHQVVEFERILKRTSSILIHDEKYREACVESVFEWARGKKRAISLVDSVIREILSDEDIRIDGFITFNLRDFSDVITKRKTPLIFCDSKNKISRTRASSGN